MQEFPGAAVVASTFDDFLPFLEAAAPSLPVITTEIGDTWIHGAASDPQKLAFTRAAGIARAACLRPGGGCIAGDAALANATRFLLKNVEHTFGRDIKTFLHDENHWKNVELQAQLAAGASNFITTRNSWQEQRDFGITYALAALPPGHPFAGPLAAAWSSVRPPPAQPDPVALGFTLAALGTALPAGASATLTFDSVTGSISLARVVLGGGQVATWGDGSATSVIGGLFEYHTYSAANYTDFINGYYCCSGTPPDWFLLDFGKPNVSEASPVAMRLASSEPALWQRADADGSAHFLLRTAVGGGSNGDAHILYGAPDTIWTAIDVPAAPSSSGVLVINVSVVLYNKTATRLPETAFVRFHEPDASAAWAVDKLGERVLPTDVQPGGNQHMHGIGAGIAVNKAGCGSGRCTLNVHSTEAGLAVFGVSVVHATRRVRRTRSTRTYNATLPILQAPTGFPTPTRSAPDMTQGTSLLLFDNIWATNYPQVCIELPW